MIKLCTIDLDGTLFDNQKNISKANIESIKQAKINGAKIVIATGRPIDGVYDVLDTLGLTTNDDYVICYNGAKILNVGKKETIYEEVIYGSDVKKLYDFAKKKQYFFHAFTSSGKLLASEPNMYTDVECRINHLNAEYIDFSKINDNDIFTKMMVVDDPDRLNIFEKEIDSYFYTKYTMVRSSKIFLEFLNKNSDKGKALLMLAKYLNIKDDETMAIGDAGNDLSMILKAHIGVAMANAFKEVLDNANYITTSNEDDGVAKAINKFINNKNKD